jgi:hypothetical protein
MTIEIDVPSEFFELVEETCFNEVNRTFVYA